MARREIKRLYRAPQKDSVFGGVCGGIANYFEVDPVLIRLLWVIFTVISFGGGILAYLIAWIIIPRR
ncbi:MAG: PspC domain-containing protein [Candidatus Pacearchaeota archaeon]